MAPAKAGKRRVRHPAKDSGQAAQLRECTHHFRVSRTIFDAMGKAAAAERRSVSAWVAICVEDRLKSTGYLA
jgi:hypothetical protein